MFDKAKTSSLSQMARELATIGEQEPEPGAEKAVLFAKCLSVLMRLEVERRRKSDDEA